MRRYYPGLTLLGRRTFSLKATVKGLKDCNETYSCGNCEKVLQCTKEFDYQCDTRTGWSWRMDKHSDHANAKGSGKPDTSGSWIPQLSLRPRYKEVLM